MQLSQMILLVLLFSCFNDAVTSVESIFIEDSNDQVNTKPETPRNKTIDIGYQNLSRTSNNLVIVNKEVLKRRSNNDYYHNYKKKTHIWKEHTNPTAKHDETLNELVRKYIFSTMHRSQAKRQTNTSNRRASSKFVETGAFTFEMVAEDDGNYEIKTDNKAQEWLNSKYSFKRQHFKFLIEKIRSNGHRERERRSVLFTSQKNISRTSFSIECTDPSLSCSGRCGHVMQYSTNEQLHCFCDKLCQMFRDCCYDFEDHCSKSMADSDIKDSKESLWFCSTAAKFPRETNGIWMIGSCPKNSTKDLNHALCNAKHNKLTLKNFKDFIPVVTRDGTTFVNQNCALCNGRRTSELTFYNVGFLCDATPPLSYSYNKSLHYLFEYCGDKRMFFQPHERTPRRYCLDLISNCSSSFLSEEGGISNNANQTAEQCVKRSVGIIYSSTLHRNFKNKYCANCSEIFHGMCGPKPSPSKAFVLPKPFSIVFDFNDVAEKKKPAWRRNTFCGSHSYVYDPYLDTCRPAVEVSLLPKLSPVINYRLLLWVKSNDTANLSTMKHYAFLTSFTGLFSVNSSRISKLHIFEKEAFKMKVMFDLSLPSPFSLGNTKSSNMKEIQSINRIIHFKDVIPMYINQQKFIIFKATKKLLGCINIDKYSHNEYVFLPRNNSAIIIKRTKEIINQKQYLANYVQKGDLWVAIGTVVVCRDHYPLLCNGAVVSLNSTEYQLLANKSIYRNVSGELFPRGTYYKVNSSILICTNYTTRVTSYGPQRRPDDLVLFVLTYVCMALSVVALSFVIITYSLFRELRTVPGIMVMHLSTSILFLQVTWIIGISLTHFKLVCFVLAVLQHYLILVSLLWMSIIAADTYRAFSATKSRVSSFHRYSKRQKLSKLAAFGWLSPLMVIIVCLSIDLTDTFKIGFGGPKGCWITNSYATIFFFVIPVSLSLIANIVLFSLTICAIRKTKKQSDVASVQSERQRREWKVYMKVATLLGFTWIFAFGEVLVSSYLSYVFLLFHLLQGFYIAVAFTFTKRTKRLYSRYFSSNACFKAHDSSSVITNTSNATYSLEIQNLSKLRTHKISPETTMEPIEQNTRL